jgi:hypothetical protein
MVKQPKKKKDIHSGPCEACGISFNQLQLVPDLDSYLCHGCIDDLHTGYISKEICEDCGEGFFIDVDYRSSGMQCKDCFSKAKSKLNNSVYVDSMCAHKALWLYSIDQDKAVWAYKREKGLEELRKHLGISGQLTSIHAIQSYIQKQNSTFMDVVNRYFQQWVKENGCDELAEMMLKQAYLGYLYKMEDKERIAAGQPSCQYDQYKATVNQTICLLKEDTMADVPF